MKKFLGILIMVLILSTGIAFANGTNETSVMPHCMEEFMEKRFSSFQKEQGLENLQKLSESSVLPFLFGFGMIIMLGLGIVSILLFVFWAWMLIDLLKRDFKGNDKIAWIIVLVFSHILGAILYYFLIFSKKKKR